MIKLNYNSKTESESALQKYSEIIKKIVRIGSDEDDVDIADPEQLAQYLEYNWLIFIEDMNELNNGTDYPIGDIYNEIFEMFSEDENYYILSYCPSVVIHVVIPKAITEDDAGFDGFLCNNPSPEKLEYKEEKNEV